MQVQYSIPLYSTQLPILSYGLMRLLAADTQPKNLSLSQDLSSNPTNMQKIQDLGVVVLVSYVSRRTLLQEDCSRLCS